MALQPRSLENAATSAIVLATVLLLAAGPVRAQDLNTDEAAPAEAVEAPVEAAPIPPPVEESETPAEVAPAPATPLVGYDKGFFLRSADELYELKIQARMQGRFTFESLESWVEDETAAVADTDKEQEMAFAIQRARLKLSGHVFTKALGYELQMDFGKGQFQLKDYFANIALVKDALHLQVGQWKRPFSRQQITSSGSQELVDRAITDKAFGGGRDIGVALHNNYLKSPTVEWALGVFNGTGEAPWFEGTIETDDETGEHSISQKSKFNNVPDKLHPMAVARLGFNTKDLKGYSEADLEGGPARFGVAASGIVDFDVDDDNKSGLRGELDYILKVQGFSTTGAVYLSSASSAGFGDQAYAAWGAHVQAGYTVKQRVQPALRYAIYDPKGDGRDQELLGGVSIYLFGHNVKWQTDAGALLHDSVDPTGEVGLLVDALVRTQLQLAF